MSAPSPHPKGVPLAGAAIAGVVVGGAVAGIGAAFVSGRSLIAVIGAAGAFCVVIVGGIVGYLVRNRLLTSRTWGLLVAGAVVGGVGVGIGAHWYLHRSDTRPPASVASGSFTSPPSWVGAATGAVRTSSGCERDIAFAPATAVDPRRLRYVLVVISLDEDGDPETWYVQRNWTTPSGSPTLNLTDIPIGNGAVDKGKRFKVGVYAVPADTPTPSTHGTPQLGWVLASPELTLVLDANAARC
ncbi:MAG TPA: hypothetical protein VI248_14915 [Kineosporiaceae bacterium]